MATSQMNRIVEHLRHTVLARDGANLSDGQLLDCFVARRTPAGKAKRIDEFRLFLLRSADRPHV